MLTGRGRETGQLAQRWQAVAFFGSSKFFKWRFLAELGQQTQRCYPKQGLHMAY
jgi:hypothetical protein